MKNSRPLPLGSSVMMKGAPSQAYIEREPVRVQ